jgi:hypothetical protein
MDYKNAEGYADPTAYEALTAVAKSEKSYKPLVYICSPYSGDVEANVKAAREYCRLAVDKGYIPVAPHLLYPQFMDDNDPAERKLGMSFGNALMDSCSELWVCGDRLSPGMEAEFDRASEKNMTIKFLTKENEE